jgi:glucokinase
VFRSALTHCTQQQEEDVLEDDTSSATAAAVVAAGMKGAFGINSSSSANASMMMLQGDGTDDGASSLPHLLAKYAQVYNKNGRIGIYTRQEREAIIARFKAKRQRRVWRKKVCVHRWCACAATTSYTLYYSSSILTCVIQHSFTSVLS